MVYIWCMYDVYIVYIPFIYGIYMAIALEPVFAFTNSQPVSLLLQTILSTLIVLITAEFLPKAIFRINPNRTLRIGALPLLLIYCLLFVPTIITMLFSKLILKLVLNVVVVSMFCLQSSFEIDFRTWQMFQKVSYNLRSKFPTKGHLLIESEKSFSIETPL